MIFLDYETRSDVPIKRGGRRYAESARTSVLCGVAFDPEARKLWIWTPYEPCLDCCSLGTGKFECDLAATLPADLAERLRGGEPVVGHNAWGFDQHIGEPGWNWLDSLPRVRRMSLPGGLDALGDMFYRVPKDGIGQKTLHKLMKPVKRTGQFVEPDGHQISAVIRYCVRDVIVLAQLWTDQRLGAEHVDDAVLEVHRTINERGIRVDVEAARRIEAAERDLTQRAIANAPDSLGDTPAAKLRALNSPKAMCAWLKKRRVRLYSGHYATDVQEPTVRKLLDLTRDDEVRAALEARLRVATVTGGKIRALLERVCPDGRLRDTTIYHGAHTGRWTGSGFQVHNLPRAKKPQADAWDPDTPLVTESLDDSAQQMQAMLRGVLVGNPWLVLADLNQIEYRVLRWCVGDEPALELIRQGVDPYQITADRMGADRDKGKVVELACGYGGGLGSLTTWSETYDVWFDDPQATIERWRDSNPLIAGVRTGSTWVNPDDPSHQVAVRDKSGFWKRTQKAAWNAVRGQASEVGRVCWSFDGDLVAELPSGRCLRYRKPGIEKVPSRWHEGEFQDALCFDSTRHGREATFGSRLVENLVQAIARDVIAWQLVQLEAAGLRPVGHVHDETWCETDNVAEVTRIMNSAPSWAAGLPVASEAKLVERYEK